MISFRYHIVSIVSVFLALAVGVALGGGPLKGTVDNTLVRQVAHDRKVKTALEAHISALRDGNTFTNTFAKTVAPTLIGGALSGHVVDIVVLPDAQATDVSEIAAMIGTAGGSVGGTLRVDKGLVQVGKKQLVDELGTQLQQSASGVAIPASAGAYERMGALIGRAIGTTKEGGARVDTTAGSILAGLSTANLMSADGPLHRRGDLVVVVDGTDNSSPQARKGTSEIVTALATAIDQQTRGVVVAGPADSARAGGALATVRNDVTASREVSTVDSVGRSAAQVVVVMALAGQAAGKTGQYGAINAADGAMPGAHASTG